MRPALENIAVIESYLLDQMTATERKEFETRMKNDETLRQMMEAQKTMMEGIVRLGLRQNVNNAFRKYKFRKILKISLVIVGLAVLSGVLYQAYTSRDSATQGSSQVNIDNADERTADADLYLPSQFFTLNTARDTVVETAQGIVLFIPANGFVTEEGKPVTGNLELELKEALDAASIISAGLSTESDGKLLETGGMFYINARQNNRILGVAPGRKIYVEIPTNELKTGMNLFDGKRMADGSINWVDPKPLEQYLVPVDIFSLNFYPPHYEDSLASWGKDAANKAFKDSLFYSFHCGYERYASPIPAETNIVAQELPSATKTSTVDSDTIARTVRVQRNDEVPDSPCQWIQPSQIRAIWNEEFQNTLLATKAFEERLPYLYDGCEGELLDLYINNLNQPMASIDSMVANRTGDVKLQKRFLQFAARKDGRVRMDDRATQRLSAYYKEKVSIFEAASRKARTAIIREQRTLDQKAAQHRSRMSAVEANRWALNFNKEFNLNLDEAYRQLGKPRPKPMPVGTYPVTVSTTGWKNVDQYVLNSTLQRTTLDYTDPTTSKKAVIKYESLKVQLQDVSSYDRTYVYLISKQLPCFQRMGRNADLFTEKLNELIEYDLVCVGWKKDQVLYHVKKDIGPGEISVTLKATDTEQLNNEIAAISSFGSNRDVIRDMADQLILETDRRRMARVQRNEALARKAYQVIFPCASVWEFSDVESLPSLDNRTATAGE